MSVRVGYAVDEEFAMPLAVSLRSLADHATAPDELAVTVATTGLRDETVAMIRRSCPELKPEFVTVTGPSPDHWHPVTSLRLRLPELADGDGPLIYLDADTVVQDDLGALRDTPLDGRTLAALRDPVDPPMPPERREVLGLAEGSPFLNDSVLVIDPVAWRKHDVVNRVVDLARTGDRLTAEEALNLVLAGDWVPLAPGWNVYHMLVGMAAVARKLGLASPVPADYLAAEPRIVHYAGDDKPWLASSARAPFSALFYSCLDRTAWAGWRPARSA